MCPRTEVKEHSVSLGVGCGQHMVSNSHSSLPRLELTIEISSLSEHVRILIQIFDPMRDENWEWRKLHNQELHNLYGSPNTSR